MMENKIQKLLNDVNVILQQEKVKKEESLKRGERFNMFSTLGVAHYEVTHSAIIASFLNPKESHGQGDKFLRIFLNTIGDRIMPDTSNASIYTEYSMDEGRIDILIEDNLGHGIIIENKIYADDQDKQLIRYNSFAHNKYGFGNYSIYYLTLYGKEARKESAKEVEYNCISYSNSKDISILKWLDDCIKESATTPLIRETLIQYRNHIKQLTNQDMETINKEGLLKTMVNNAEAIEAICNLQIDYEKYVYETMVKPEFEKYASRKGLVFRDTNLFASRGERGFYFYRKEWTSAAIWFYTWRSGESEFIWGVSNYSGDGLHVEETKLDCLEKSPDKVFPYGTGNLGQYTNWDMNTYTEMVKGNFVEYITSLVDTALDEIGRKGLPMP